MVTIAGAPSDTLHCAEDTSLPTYRLVSSWNVTLGGCTPTHESLRSCMTTKIKEGRVNRIGISLLVLTLLALAACENDTSRTPTPTIDPAVIVTVAEIGDLYRTHPARAEVRFERGPVYISDVVSEFHDEKDEVFLGAARSREKYTTLRIHATVDSIAKMDIGNRVFLRCDELMVETHSPAPFLGVEEFVCRAGKILDFNHRLNTLG